MRVKTLDWDSDFFRKKIGELIVEDASDAININDDFEIIYVKENNDNQLFIKGFQQSLIETKVVFVKRLSGIEIPKNCNIIAASSDNVNIEEIYELAFESGKFSRFKLDENFSENEFKTLYKKWVDNSFLKKFADKILVFIIDSEVCGFVTYKVTDDFAVIGLIATAMNKQGQGIGTQMINEVERRLLKMKVKELRIPTQLQNHPACKFYSKLGYRILEKSVIKHYWKV